MPSTNQELARRADLAIADLSANGGMMSQTQTNTFIDMIVAQPTILQQARVIRMPGPSHRINRIGFGSRIVHAAPQGTSPFAADDGTNDRYLAAAKRAKPTTGKLELNTSEVIAEVHLPYEVLEDNIEGQSFEAHVMRLIAEQAASDFEELALTSDTTSNDADLALFDGFIKLANEHEVDLSAQTDVDGNSLNSGIHPATFANAMLALPKQYHRNLSQLRHYLTVADTIKYRARVAQRQTGYGDSALTDNGRLTVLGVPVEQAPLMPSGYGLFTFPQNLIFGIQRAISVETDKDIRSREIIIVLTARITVAIDLVDAAVLYKNIGSAP